MYGGRTDTVGLQVANTDWGITNFTTIISSIVPSWYSNYTCLQGGGGDIAIADPPPLFEGC